MDKELKTFVDSHKGWFPNHWSKDQQIQEMARWALEAGYGELPELDMSGGHDIGHEGGVSQKKYDKAVEEAYSWLLGECKEYLK